MNVFICCYRYLTEKFLWPRNYAVYREWPNPFQLIDKEEQRLNPKMWYTGKFNGQIIDIKSEQPFQMSKRRAERVASSFPGGRIKQISPDPFWFSVIYPLIFDFFPFSLLTRGYSSFKKISPFIDRLNCSFQVKCAKGADLQKERPTLQGAEITLNQVHLLYDRELNIENFPPPSDFSVFVCGERREVGSIGYGGTRENFPDIVRLMLATSVSAGEEVRIFYVPRKEPIEDLHGNPSQSFDIFIKNSTK